MTYCEHCGAPIPQLVWTGKLDIKAQCAYCHMGIPMSQLEWAPTKELEDTWRSTASALRYIHLDPGPFHDVRLWYGIRIGNQTKDSTDSP